MGFPRQEYWTGLSFPPPGDFPDPEIEPSSRVDRQILLQSEPPRKPLESRKRFLAKDLPTQEAWALLSKKLGCH